MKGIRKQSFGEPPPAHVIGHDAPLGEEMEMSEC